MQTGTWAAIKTIVETQGLDDLEHESERKLDNTVTGLERFNDYMWLNAVV